MRKVWSKWLAVAVVAITILAISPANAQRSVSLQVFYDELQPYGNWIDHGRYGYVWMPQAGPDFVPYGSNGYWVQTGYGNTWVSNYSWGWAPFHYGRWFYDDFYGWLWVPDTNWGPAWVTWRSGGGYYGWAPLMPGLSVSMNVGYYNSIPHHYWNFVPYRYVMYRQVYRHCVPRPRVVNVINQTTVIVNNNNHYYDNDGVVRSRERNGNNDAEYFTGPSRSEIEKRNGERVTIYDVHDSDAPGRPAVSRNSISMYKPSVQQPTRTRAYPSAVIRDNEEGRENISRIRSRQMGQEGSSNPLDVNRNATRQGRNSSFDNTSTFERPSRDGAVPADTRRGIDDLRRELGSDDAEQRRSSNNNTERNETRREALDRLNRDTDVNSLQRRRQYDEQPRQPRDVQQQEQLQRDDQMQRIREQREQGMRERQQRFQEQRQLQERQQEQMNRSTPREYTEPSRRQQPEQNQRAPRPAEQLQPRERSESRQVPSREPAQFERTAPARQPARQQYSAPQQRQSSEQRMSTPSRSSSEQVQRPSSTRSSQSRSRD